MDMQIRQLCQEDSSNLKRAQIDVKRIKKKHLNVLDNSLYKLYGPVQVEKKLGRHEVSVH